jgi:hypothetical protein
VGESCARFHMLDPDGREVSSARVRVSSDLILRLAKAVEPFSRLRPSRRREARTAIFQRAFNQISRVFQDMKRSSKV